MNKNTKAARKKGLTNSPVIMVNTGTARRLETRRADKIFKGAACATAFGSNPDCKRQSSHSYPQGTKRNKCGYVSH